MPLIFSYGSLQQERVQLSTFGRRLYGHPDELLGFELARSRNARHANVIPTGGPHSRVSGTVFEITEAELASIDRYEQRDAYARIAAPLASGKEAWVYVERAGQAYEMMWPTMNKKSIWAIGAGVIVIIVVTTLVDILLHAAGVFPPMDQPLTDALALLATAYRIVISIGGAWLTARLAPAQPLRHAMMLGYVGGVLGLVVVLAIPQCWVGGKIYERQIIGAR